jgi:hypothetical protein
MVTGRESGDQLNGGRRRCSAGWPTRARERAGKGPRGLAAHPEASWLVVEGRGGRRRRQHRRLAAARLREDGVDPSDFGLPQMRPSAGRSREARQSSWAHWWSSGRRQTLVEGEGRGGHVGSCGEKEELRKRESGQRIGKRE